MDMDGGEMGNLNLSWFPVLVAIETYSQNPQRVD